MRVSRCKASLFPLCAPSIPSHSPQVYLCDGLSLGAHLKVSFSFIRHLICVCRRVSVYPALLVFSLPESETLVFYVIIFSNMIFKVKSSYSFFFFCLWLLFVLYANRVLVVEAHFRCWASLCIQGCPWLALTQSMLVWAVCFGSGGSYKVSVSKVVLGLL